MVTYGNDTPFPRSVWYTGSDELKVGYALCYDHDTTEERTSGDGGVPNRAYHVEKPGVSNLKHFAGVVCEGHGGKTGPCEVEVIRPGISTRGVKVWTDQNVPIGALLGLQPDSYAMGLGGVVSGPAARAMEAQDRSTTAGRVVAELGPREAFVADERQQIQQYFDHFTSAPTFSETADAAEWLLTLIDAGMDDGEVFSISDDEPGGWLRSVTNDADNDANSFQLNGEMFQLAAEKPLYYEVKLKVDDADTQDLMFGLGVADTDLLGDGVADAIYYEVPDGTSALTLDYVLEKGGAETTTTGQVSLADDTAVTCGFYFNGESVVQFIVNEAVQTAPSAFTNIPDDEALSPFFEQRNASAAASILEIDYLLIRQQL